MLAAVVRTLLSLLALLAASSSALATDAPRTPRTRPAPPRQGTGQACALRPGDELTGSYYCAQGDTDLTLRVLSLAGSSLRVEFVFRHEPSRAAGRFTLVGECVGEHVTLRPEAWIERPAGYIMVGMEGDAERGGRFAGRMTHPSCGAFSVTVR